LPRFSALAGLALYKECAVDSPFLIVSGTVGDEKAVAAMKAGAHDYVMKDRLARLVPAVERELREAEMRRAQKKYEEELQRAHDELETRVEKRTADLKTANLKLQSALEERRRLENELLEIAENERRRIGFDLHDDLGQKLTGVSMMIKGLEQRLCRDQHACAEDARKSGELIEQMIHHTHQLARQFSSLDVAGDDLADALKQLAANVEKMFGISCVLTMKGEIPVVPGNGTMQFYKIAQEAVSNAIKHGQATRVAISVSGNSDKLVLTIRNDGVPFELPEGKKNRMGLRIMNYRARTVGATFDIQPNHKNGTIVTCMLPIKSNGRAAREEADRAAENLPPSRSKHRRETRVEEQVS
jgi:signal transduction histidine kinase